MPRLGRNARVGPIARLLVGIGALLGTAACGGDEARPGASGRTAPTVYAAASLTEVFPRIDSDARYSFGGSGELATQIREGAPADVYAGASARDAQELHGEGLLGEPVTFASNRLVVIVPRDNPAGIGAVGDLARPGTKLVVAAEGVPAGDYARTVLAELGLEGALGNVVSNEDDVKGVVAKVAIGEADAGFVYATDAAAAGDVVRVVEPPDGVQPPIEYQIGVVEGRGNAQAAEAFVAAVLGPQGREELEAAGFDVPVRGG